MKLKWIFGGLLPCILFSTPSFSFSPSNQPIYVVANAGVFTGTFNLKYLDKEDEIKQSISETIQQKGYVGSVGIGFSKKLCRRYLLGLELSGSSTTQNATFQSGAATSAFTDKFTVENYFDLVAVPGVFLTPSLAAYVKLGATRGEFSDSLNTLAGFDPTKINMSSTRHAYGFTGSIGLKKWLFPVFAVTAEYNYRDYGTVRFPHFGNFTTTYTHDARIYGQSVQLGFTYQLV